MIRESVSIDDVVALLNEALALDAEAISRLFLCRVPCNTALADHPTIQCGSRESIQHRVVGPLGLLNGMFGVDERGWGAICAVVENHASITRFERVSASAADAVHCQVVAVDVRQITTGTALFTTDAPKTPDDSMGLHQIVLPTGRFLPEVAINLGQVDASKCLDYDGTQAGIQQGFREPCVPEFWGGIDQ